MFDLAVGCFGDACGGVVTSYGSVWKARGWANQGFSSIEVYNDIEKLSVSGEFAASCTDERQGATGLE